MFSCLSFSEIIVATHAIISIVYGIGSYELVRVKRAFNGEVNHE